MSEEEKRAIDFLKGVCTDDCVNKEFVVKPILYLIEKQQKELEQEKEKNIFLEGYKVGAEEVIKELKEKNKKLEEKYKRLSIEAQATAFEDDNIDTEGLLRVLLKQGEITLNEKGEYQRKDFDWEDNMMQLGLMKKREKTFYIPDDECLDEYTKQLENQLKEYNELKRIFRERNITNETMYDGFCRLYDEVENLKEIEQSHKEENGKLRVEFEKVYEDNLTLANELKQEKEKNNALEKHQKQYLDGELITAKQGKFFEKMIKENYIRKDKLKAIQCQLYMQLGSYVRDEANPEQERIAGGINIINKILEENNE